MPADYQLFINGHSVDAESGETFETIDPSTGRQTWTSNESTAEDVDRAVKAARAAFEDWALTPLEARIAICQRFRDLLKEHSEELAQLISIEVGKPLWEARTEVTTMANKVDISVQAYQARTGESLAKVADGDADVLQLDAHAPHATESGRRGQVRELPVPAQPDKELSRLCRERTVYRDTRP